jgi:hypothetical protein
MRRFRLPRSAAALSLAVALCLGTSAGPVLADDQPSSPSPATTVPAPREPGTTTPEASAPSTTEPTTASTPAEPTPSSPSPSAAPEAQEVVDLRLRVWFEKPSFAAHELITAHASVTNVGTATAHNVVVHSSGNVWPVEWQPLQPGGEGATLAPGQTAEATATGYVQEDFDAVRLLVTAYTAPGEPDANPDDNTVSATVPLVILRGCYRATVYGDRDADRVMDPGEGLSGVDVTVFGGRPKTIRQVTTDHSGTFELSDLPLGSYDISFSDYPGWAVMSGAFKLDAAEVPNGLFRGRRQAQGSLTASMDFTQQSYRAGDVAHAILTLRNTGTIPLTDLQAECRLVLLSSQVDADVGELTPGGPGVTMPAGTTRQFGVTVPITEESTRMGHARLGCDVGAPPRVNGIPRFDALARVTGGVASKVTGELLQVRLPVSALGPPPGVPVPGVKVYLRDQFTNAVIARDMTDTYGRFTFYDLSAGLHRIGVVGPWELIGVPDFLVLAGENGSSVHRVLVKPGPAQPDPDTVPPGGNPPAPGPPVAWQPPLAVTGASVTWLALGGLLSLVSGSALMLGTSRRLRR